ncbi:MAG: sensor domain-containing diguanylate cyclase [Sulfuricurvum sp.]|nr:sensor domain-containing diguanylate cyclase [Sulfuricurvum sp.]
MFKTENYVSEILSSIDTFYIDFEQEGYLNEKNFKYAHTLNEHKNLFVALFECNTPSEADEKMEEFVYFCVSHDIPYMFVYGELLTITRNLIRIFAQEEDLDNLKHLNTYLDKLENQITIAYFYKFLRRLAAKNHLRLSHLSNLIEKNLMIHYQRHIEWMIQLIDYIQYSNENRPFPELNHDLCGFGQWLHNAALPYITATSHFKGVGELHHSLHDLASEVVQQCQNGLQNPKHLIHLMQRIDYTSLEIGNEIAILNDMIIIEEYSKDPLTGLLSRRLFEKIMTSQIEIAKATETQCALMMCDLDHFKTVNDTYGHLAGDMVIQNFANILRTLLRTSDFIFRFGGEEFIILLPSTSEHDARKIAQKICDHVAEHEVIFNNIPLRYTVSIGTIPINTQATSYVLKDTIHRYVAEVDSKLYLAKQNGRNRVE